jgi:hypothetical protein
LDNAEDKNITRNTQVSWSGFGTAINNTTALTKTYYVLIAAGRWWKIKLNGQTIVTTGINTATCIC